jgi:Lhr-like helicase
MKKIVKLTESDLVSLIKKIIVEDQILLEQPFLSKFLGSAGDDLIRVFGKESLESFSNILSRSLSNKNVSFFQGGKQYLKSASGSMIDVDQIELVLKAIQQNKISVEDASVYFPRQLSDGTEFRQAFINSFSKKTGSSPSSQTAASQAASKAASSGTLPSWVSSKWLVTTNTNTNIAKLFEKLNKLRNSKFDPSSVKVTNTTTVYGREILEIKLPTGDEVLLYKSTGTGAPKFKQAGDWQLINGFQPSPTDPNDIKWFIKNEETTQLTKGLNKYATELANFVKNNGWQSLGK